MLLEPLVSTIETLKQRISTHGAALRQNETRTRAALIDPLLKTLGWDTSDPAMVLPEYDVSGRKADYALLDEGGGPAATVEAKKLGEPLAPHRMQMLNYSNASGVGYAGLTDGDKWELYEVFKRGQLDERKILDVSIANTPTHEVVLKLLLLWRTNLASGQPVAAKEPVLIAPFDDPPVDPDPPAPTPVPDRTENWNSLSIVEAGKGNNPPTGIRFPGREPRGINSWTQVLVEVADRLSEDGVLRAADCPIAGLGFINSSAAGTGGGTSGRYKTISGGLYVNVNWRADNIIKHSRRLLTHFNVDPATVELRFE